jgi:hypothetical protein
MICLKKTLSLLSLITISIINVKGQHTNAKQDSSVNQKIYEYLLSVDNTNTLDFNFIKKQNPNFRFSEKVLYWGDLKNNLPDGYGIKYSPDSLFYAGEFKGGMYNGNGIKLGIVTLFIGQFRDDFINGYGYLYGLSDSSFFEKNLDYLCKNELNKITRIQNIVKEYSGLFSDMDKEKRLRIINGSISNYAIDSSTNELKYKIKRSGKFKNESLVEKGVLEIDFINFGTIKSGKFIYYGNVEGMPKGSAVCLAFDEKNQMVTKYDGSFTDIFDFKGKRTAFDGTTSEGQFTNFKLSGLGRQSNEEYDYNGEFVNDVIEGKGKMSYKDPTKHYPGSYFEGNFRQNIPISGTYYNAQTREYIKGDLIDGKFEGKVTVTLDGKVKSAIYRNGVKE